MAAILVDKLSSIDLGRQGENLARTIEIDVNSILEKWPDAEITLLVKRKGDTEPYPAETSVENGILYWPVTLVDTANAGEGKIEIHAVSGEVIAKSVIATIRVSACLAGTETGEVPEAAQGWVDSLLQKADDMKAALEEAKEVVQAAQDTPAIVSEASGSMVTVADGAARAAQGMTSTIAAVQAGTGDPSTDNVRALSGWDAVSVTRTGRNLLSHLDYVTTNGHKATIITADVIDVTSPTAYDYGNVPVFLKAGVSYTLVIDWEVYGRDESSTLATRFLSRMDALESANNYMNAYANGVMRSVKTYTPDADVATKLMLHPNYGSGLAACSRTRVMLIEGAYTTDTAPAFEPCERQVISAALPETVYGGTLDWVTGLLTVTHGQIASYAGEAVADGWVSSTGELSNGAQVVYPLETPYTIQLDPQTLTLLKGSNAVWSDCGDTSIAYIADTKLYIDSKFAALAASIVNA